jgi:cell wall-associated NlpC family hydrolase
MRQAYAVPSSAQKQAEADEASARLAALEAEKAQMEEDYTQAQNAHIAAITAMEEAQGRIDVAQGVINETQGKLGTRANSMYRSGPLSFLDVLFGANSFEEFTTTWDILNNINNQNAELIQANRDAREVARVAHEEYSAQEQVAADRLVEAETIMARAEENVAAQSAELASLEAEVAELVEAEAAARAAALAAVNNSSNGGGGGGGYSGIIGGGNAIGEPIPSGGYPGVVAAAQSRLGLPYVWGASGPNSFDCSGLTSWCYTNGGMRYPGRVDTAQRANANATWPYSGPDSAAPGDILWWPGHVALYVGGGSYIHAPQSGDVVRYSNWNINSATVCRFY